MIVIDYTAYFIEPTHRGQPRQKVTREEFEAECIAISGGTVEQLREYHEIMECDCGSVDCPGWRAVYLLKNRRRARKAVGA